MDLRLIVKICFVTAALGCACIGIRTIIIKKVNTYHWGKFTGTQAVIIGLGQLIIGALGFIVFLLMIFSE